MRTCEQTGRGLGNVDERGIAVVAEVMVSLPPGLRVLEQQEGWCSIRHEHGVLHHRRATPHGCRPRGDVRLRGFVPAVTGRAEALVLVQMRRSDDVVPQDAIAEIPSGR